MRRDTREKASEARVTVFVCGALCKDGKEHDFTGPVIEFDGGATATCAVCGVDAMTDSLMRLP